MPPGLTQGRLAMSAATDIWEIDSYRLTPGDAIAKFCREYWDRPRKYGRIVDNRFQLLDGEKWYEVRWHVPKVGAPVYIVSRLG